MNIQQLKTSGTSNANHLIADFAKDVSAECKCLAETGQYGWIARRHVEDIVFGISIVMVLFLIASVIAISFYTFT